MTGEDSWIITSPTDKPASLNYVQWRERGTAGAEGELKPLRFD